VAALHAIPNYVIPYGSVRCTKDEDLNVAEAANAEEMEIAGVTNTDLTGEVIANSVIVLHSKFTIAFPENLGKLKQPKLNFYLDGTRPTLYTDE